MCISAVHLSGIGVNLSTGRLQVRYWMGLMRLERKARFQAVGTAPSESWIHALPSSNLGRQLGNDETRIAIGLRMGFLLVLMHQCACGSQVLPNGHHGLSCRRSNGRLSRHAAISAILASAFHAASTPSWFQLPGLLRVDGKGPDEVTMIPWCLRRTLRELYV